MLLEWRAIDPHVVPAALVDPAKSCCHKCFETKRNLRGCNAVDHSRARPLGHHHFFNPVRYQRRLANYKVFRQRLDVPLIAIELAYGPNFELQQHDAEILLQIRGDAVLWQKEKLLNLAL